MNKIIELKKHRGLTNEDISHILEANHSYRYSRATVSRWLTGDRKCPEEVITVLAGPDLLDVDNEYLGELFDEVYSEKHPNPPDQMCIDDECVEATPDYITLADMCIIFQKYLPYPYLKLLLDGFNNKSDEYGRLKLSSLSSEDIRTIMFPLWNCSKGQKYYDRALLVLFKKGLLRGGVNG